MDIRQFCSDHNVIFKNLIIGLVKLQVLGNWLEVYAGKNLLHSIKWRACKYQNMGFGFGMDGGLKTIVAGVKSYLILKLM